jgi:hypothetical protein
VGEIDRDPRPSLHVIFEPTAQDRSEVTSEITEEFSIFRYMGWES